MKVTTLLISAATAVAGIAIGALIMMLAEPGAKRSVKPAAKEAADLGNPAQSTARASENFSERRLRGVEGRILELEKNKAQPSPSESSESEPPPVPDRERSRQLATERLRARNTAFTSEPIDPEWSNQATQSFTADLARVGATSKYTTVGLECRATLCRAKLRWSSYEEAQNNWKNVLHTTYAKNCAKEMYAPAPADPSLPYEGTAFFDCTDERTQ